MTVMKDVDNTSQMALGLKFRECLSTHPFTFHPLPSLSPFAFAPNPAKGFLCLFLIQLEGLGAFHTCSLGPIRGSPTKMHIKKYKKIIYGKNITYDIINFVGIFI